MSTNDKYLVTCGEGGGGSRSTRSGRQREGARIVVNDRRLRTNNIRQARVQVGARTQRSRTRTI